VTTIKIEYRLMARRPGTVRYVYDGKVSSVEVGEKRIAMLRKIAAVPGWEYRIDQRTVTYTAWRKVK
jgi:hypothetical protein